MDLYYNFGAGKSEIEKSAIKQFNDEVFKHLPILNTIYNILSKNGATTNEMGMLLGDADYKFYLYTLPKDIDCLDKNIVGAKCICFIDYYSDENYLIFFNDITKYLKIFRYWNIVDSVNFVELQGDLSQIKDPQKWINRMSHYTKGIHTLTQPSIKDLELSIFCDELVNYYSVFYDSAISDRRINIYRYGCAINDILFHIITIFHNDEPIQ